jgi:hypothetical protein
MIKRISVTSLVNPTGNGGASRAGSGLSRSQSTRNPGATTPRRPTSMSTTPLPGPTVPGPSGSPGSSESGSDSRPPKPEKSTSKRIVGFAQLQQALKKLRKAPSSSALNSATVSSPAAASVADKVEIQHYKGTLRSKVPKRARRARSVRSREKASTSPFHHWFGTLLR